MMQTQLFGANNTTVHDNVRWITFYTILPVKGSRSLKSPIFKDLLCCRQAPNSMFFNQCGTHLMS